MALKDLKSDLSKFRMPKLDPLEKKKVTEVNKKLNQTPLSSRLSSIADIGKIDKTPTKSGINPSQFDNSSKFLGETNPSKMGNSSNFLGETNPSKMDNSSKFLGETDSNKFDNSSKFLGETDINKFDNSSNFLGETNPSKMDNSSNFLGETNPSNFDNSSNFLGETNPSNFDNSSNFLGETNPNQFDNSSNFLGETNPNQFDNSSNFLGETTPSNFDNSSNFLGETNPNQFDNSSNFLGETTPGEVNYIDDIHAEGFTSKVNGTKFIGINPDNTLFDNTNSKYSNFLNSFPGLSFAPGYDRFKPIGSYTGDTQRYNPDKKYYIDSNLTNQGISQLQEMVGSPSFLDKMYDKFNLKDDSFNTTLPLTRHPLVLSGIQKKGGNPENFGQFGLSFDDGFIRGGTITATTRAFIDTARIATWLLSPKGVLWSSKQVGMQRLNRSNKIWTPANLLTAVGSQHLGLKPKRSGLIPFDILQPSPRQKLESIYLIDRNVSINPIQGSIIDTDPLGGFDSFYGIGITNTTRYKNTFRSRHAFLQKFNPFDSITTTAAPHFNGIGYDNPSEGYRGDTYEKSVPDTDDEKKDFGLGRKKDDVHLSGRYLDGDKHSNGIRDEYENQKLNPFKKDDEDKSYAPSETTSNFNQKDNVSVPDDTTDKLGFGLAGKDPTQQNNTNQKIPSVVDGKEKSDSNLAPIQQYETISYGRIKNIARNRSIGDTSNTRDFRKDLSSDNVHNKIATGDDYNKYNVNKRTWFQDPGQVGADRSVWWNVSKNSAQNNNNERYDRINALNPGESTGGRNPDNDLVHLWFKPLEGQKVQFRGTVSGISETFSPSWESIKYQGRADSAHKYTSFSRSVSFNFRVFATSRIEMKPLWKKLERLSTMTMPKSYENDSNGYKGTLLKFRLGSLWNDHLAFITSLSYTIMDDVSWEISIWGSKESLGELPKGIDVSITLELLDNKIVPQLEAPIYDFTKVRE